MRFENVFIPYGRYWCTPFCRWQGALAGEHPLRLLARCGAEVLQQKGEDILAIDGLHLGTTVPQDKSFWGAPWVAAMMGNERITGPTIAQACATSARVIASAAAMIETGTARRMLALAADRTSNGPHIYYPSPSSPGGTGSSENWVLDNFGHDPHAQIAMVDTAENIARRCGISRREQDETVLLRYGQYGQALAGDRAFQRRYMIDLTVRQGKKPAAITGDQGVTASTPEGLAALAPVREGGTVTYGGQTHPADGHAGMVLRARPEAQAGDEPLVRILSYGEGRADRGHMGMAPVPAARAALAEAGLEIADIAAIKTHNPFVVNDIYFSREMGVPLEAMNRFGSSLVFGHPQGPTGLRLVIELVEELVSMGGGYGLYTGCAAGDTGAAIVLRVD